MKSSIRRVLVSFVSVFALVFTGTLVGAPAQAATDKTVTIHYHRYAAGEYANWALWLWPHTSASQSGNGAQVTFDGSDDFGAKTTRTIAGSAAYTGIGFIVKKTGSWDKDVDLDRFITEFVGNSAEIWLVEGDQEIYTSKPDTGDKIRSADFTDFTHIKTTLTSKLALTGSGANGFSLSDGTNSIAVTSVSAATGSTTSSNNLNLTLASAITLGKTYTLSHTSFASGTVTARGILSSTAFNDAYYYSGADLGSTYSKASTTFKVWAPTASKVELLTYASAATADDSATAVDMVRGAKGVWSYTLSGDQHLTIYNYRVTAGSDPQVAVDPYARSVTANGNQGVVLDLAKTDPTGFDAEKSPAFSGKATDAIIYEVHVRDLSMDSNSGISSANKGKYLAFTEVGTKTPDSKSPTGISALKDLGVTHVELLPVFDFATVDEVDKTKPQFNWGYDPKNYNAPEGSYSSDATNPIARVKELKQAIAAMHSQGMRVNMDVVYNHVSNASEFSWQKIVPGYYFRYEPNGTLANGSGCGNEVASERPMVRKFITESVAYWAKEYHFDGFRFDLMGLHDITTMNGIRSTLDAIDPTIVIIGEGWNMGDVLSSSERANQKNAELLPRIGQFNDGIRDGIKGSWDKLVSTGYAQGNQFMKTLVSVGIVANTQYSSSLSGLWGKIQPDQSVTYAENHDNHTLFDKIKASMPMASVAKRTSVFGLASSIALLAQGVPFIHAGQEFMRTKNGDGNSYNTGDAINSLKWQTRVTNAKMVDYFKGLVKIKKNHPAFRMQTAAQIKANLKFKSQAKSVVSYSLNGKAVGDTWSTIFVVHNQNSKAVTVNLPSKGNWKIMASGLKAGEVAIKTLRGATKVSVPATATMILTK